jgi:putative nucleotidyltransferase with HDIG domain
MNGLNQLLLVEEKKGLLKHLTNFLPDGGINISEKTSLKEAANLLLESNDFSLTLINMVSLDNQEIDILQKIRSSNPQLSIILLAGKEKPEKAISLLKKGLINHLVDPDNHASIFSAVVNELNKRTLLEKNEIFRKKLDRLSKERAEKSQRTSDLEDIYNTTLENLMTALDLRDVETYGHSKTVAKYSEMLAKILGIKDKGILDSIKKGALLHDVGKIAIPDSILKKPSHLSAEEWEKIKQHPALGYGLIKEIKLLKEAGNIILYHHERYDGAGYPYGLKGEEIPQEARIFALADALDAITSYRPYRKERDFTFAKNEIQENAKKQFDPEVVNAFCSVDMDTWKKIRFQTTKLIPSFFEMKSA